MSLMAIHITLGKILILMVNKKNLSIKKILINK